MVTDSIVQPSHNHHGKLARNNVLSASTSRVDRLSEYPSATPEGRRQRSADGGALPGPGAAATASVGLSGSAGYRESLPLYLKFFNPAYASYRSAARNSCGG